LDLQTLSRIWLVCFQDLGRSRIKKIASLFLVVDASALRSKKEDEIELAPMDRHSTVMRFLLSLIVLHLQFVVAMACFLAPTQLRS
jgi:hypothetical protein